MEVKKIQEARKLSDEQATQLFTQNFEHSLDQLIGAIRNQYRVSEKAMDTSFKQHQNDPDVRAAIQNMRTLSQTSAAPAAAAGSGAAQAAPAQAGAASLPESLTKDRLREIMTFNAVTLEKELKPIKEQMARIREQGQTPQVSPQLLQQVQARISEQVGGGRASGRAAARGRAQGGWLAQRGAWRAPVWLRARRPPTRRPRAQVRKKYGVSDEEVMMAVEVYGAREDPAFKDILQRIANTFTASFN